MIKPGNLLSSISLSADDLLEDAKDQGGYLRSPDYCVGVEVEDIIRIPGTDVMFLVVLVRDEADIRWLLHLGHSLMLNSEKPSYPPECEFHKELPFLKFVQRDCQTLRWKYYLEARPFIHVGIRRSKPLPHWTMGTAQDIQKGDSILAFIYLVRSIQSVRVFFRDIASFELEGANEYQRNQFGKSVRIQKIALKIRGHYGKGMTSYLTKNCGKTRSTLMKNGFIPKKTNHQNRNFLIKF